MHYAQTNIQLYEQLLAARWSAADIVPARAAYELAMRIFAGHFRPSHKPFLAHLVGVASILATHGADPSLVAAGMLHSAYSHGEFGDASRGVTPAKRQVVRCTVGEACESLIARYTELKWKLADLERLSGGAAHLPALERSAAIVKLADVLEDHLQRGMEYSPKKHLPGGSDSEGRWREAFIRLAGALGSEGLAAELREAFDSQHADPLPKLLFGDRDMSFLLAPISHRVKTGVRIGKFFRRWQRKLGRYFGQANGRQAA